MEYRSYVNGSPKVSIIGFGAWQLGNNIDWSGMTDTEAIHLVHKALDEGINFFDTAPNYGFGKSEELLGKALKDTKRESIVINTKFGHHSDGHTDYGQEQLRASIEGSLKRLNTEYIDSVLLHSPPKDYLIAKKVAHYEILEKLKREGKILAYGASLDTKDDMETFLNHTEGQVIEAFFNILHQDTRYAFDLAGRKNVKIIAKIPLDSGWLSGKYDKDSTFSGIRSRWTKEDITTRGELVEKLRKLPKGEQTLAQMALRYCIAYEQVATVIPGINSVNQLMINLDSLRYSIDPSLVQWLEEFYEKEVEPQNLVW